MNESLRQETNPESRDKLSRALETIAFRMERLNPTTSMKDRLRATVSQESTPEQEVAQNEEQETSTLPNPFRTKPKPKGTL